MMRSQSVIGVLLMVLQGVFASGGVALDKAKCGQDDYGQKCGENQCLHYDACKFSCLSPTRIGSGTGIFWSVGLQI